MDARRLIVAERDRAARRIAALTDGISAIDAATGFAAADDEHDPEGTPLSLERSQAVALLADAEAEQAEADAALARLDAGTYGVCATCGEPIAPGRLEARPFTRVCIRCA